MNEQATEMADAAQEQFNAVLDEYKNILPVAESFGLSVGSFEVQMGILPEIKTSLVCLLERINSESAKKIH